MSLRVTQRRVALAEIAAAAWYESRFRGGRAAFRVAVARCVVDIAALPLSHVVVRGDLRAAPVSPYPYLLFYRVTPTRIIVAAVRHAARQDPAAGLGDDPTE